MKTGRGIEGPVRPDEELVGLLVMAGGTYASNQWWTGLDEVTG
jgi:hypothetical protein